MFMSLKRTVILEISSCYIKTAIQKSLKQMTAEYWSIIICQHFSIFKTALAEVVFENKN